MAPSTLFQRGEKDSTGKDVSDIIKPERSSNGTNILEVTNRWRIDSSNAEGIAFTSDKDWFSSPTLIVSADKVPSTRGIACLLMPPNFHSLLTERPQSKDI